MSNFWFELSIRLLEEKIWADRKFEQMLAARKRKIANLNTKVGEQIKANKELKVKISRLNRSIKGCRKLRFNRSKDALAFAEWLEKRNSEEYTVYECEYCPPKPVTETKYFHVTHRDEELRGLYK